MRRSFILSLTSGIILSLGFIPFNFNYIFSWFGFVPLFFVLKDKPKLRSFLIAYMGGFIFWIFTIWWLIHVTLWGTILLVLYLALYFGIFGFVFSLTRSLSPTYHLLFIPATWVLLEYLRSHLFTGFGWALLGYSQCLNLPIIQIADFGGVWIVSFLVMLVNIGIYSVISYQWSVMRRKIILPILFLVATLIYGYYKLSLNPNSYLLPNELRISVIQGNIPQEMKWHPQRKDFILEKYLRLTQQASLKDNPDLIIWPEASLPGIKGEEPLYYKKVLDFIQEIRKPLLLGLVSFEDGLYYNSAELILDDKTPPQNYRKLHLVPFGEYIPLKKIFPFLEAIVPIGDFSAGRDYTIFKISNSKFQIPNRFSVLICFEDIFPELSREFVRKGAGFLVNITNDAWFGRSPSAYQHLSASVFRAVENRSFLVRCANTGISAFISPTGKIICRLKDKADNDIFIEGYLTQVIRAKDELYLTLYNRYPWLFPFLLFLVFIYGIINRCKVIIR